MKRPQPGMTIAPEPPLRARTLNASRLYSLPSFPGAGFNFLPLCTCADLVKEHGVPPFTDEVFCPACRTVFPDTRHYPALRNLECTADLDRVDHLPPRLKYNPLSFVEDEDLGPPTSDSPIFADLARIEARKKGLEECKASIARRLVVLRNLKEESEEVRKRLGYSSATPRGWQWVLQPAQAVIIEMTR
ncbi:hypothetical protein PC9H_006727 [Pleurotus ostreatus]|uniref:Uncharacterized protein n=1 Tax=Pleurotus ostreatus TaxID=5322 RepID=A0A8H7DVV6_PLEOS|nr:uncharacterized protein PC9H_006727 [Pleurotus ostreatus]KAF7431012.1 hypothetical protein PC9H_006727 [Pleurotus ostreatus]